MLVTGIDHASANVDLAAAVAAGYAFTLRYLPPSRYGVTAGERDRIHATGLGLGLIWQIEADRSLRGAGQGVADAQRANQEADRMGAPEWLRIPYVAADFGATEAQYRGPIADYARAFTVNSTRPCMPYAPYLGVEILCGQLRINPFGWQCAGYSGTGQGSGGSYRCGDGSVRRLSRYAAMFQDVGARVPSTDHNVVLADVNVDWAWGGRLQPPQHQEADDMARPIYKFPDGFAHQNAHFPAIDLRFGAYPTAGGVKDGFHWRHLDALEAMIAVQRGFLDPDNVQRFASGNDDLDNLYGSLPYVYPGDTFTPPAAQPVTPAPAPAPQPQPALDVDDLARTVAGKLTVVPR